MQGNKNTYEGAEREERKKINKQKNHIQYKKEFDKE